MKTENVTFDRLSYPEEEDYSHEAANSAYGLLISIGTIIGTLTGVILGICSFFNSE